MNHKKLLLCAVVLYYIVYHDVHILVAIGVAVMLWFVDPADGHDGMYADLIRENRVPPIL